MTLPWAPGPTSRETSPHPCTEAPLSPTNMSAYWDAYPNFVHNTTAPLRREFNLLAAQCGWSVGGKKYKREWERCGREEFTHQFGRDENRLAGWQAMCATMNVEVPDSIKKCKQVRLDM